MAVSKRAGKSYKSARFWVQAAAIGGLYAALTVALSAISYGPLQVRVSEALTVLPALTPAAVPGLFVGCIVSNIISPYGLPDLIIGSCATLIAAALSYILRTKSYLVPLPPIVLNGVFIGAMLYFIYGVQLSLMIDMAWVALGEAVACYALGYPLLLYLSRRKHIFRLWDGENRQ